jgi:hypothetical protein
VQVPHGFKPVCGLNIICVDTPSGKVAEKYNSYDLSIFSSGADSQGAKIFAASTGGSSRASGSYGPT